ncbi:MAG: ATP-binding protein [Candidatus Aenigmatarchaeota archaeon]
MIDLLTKFNDWWTTGKVSEKDLEKYRRYLFYTILKYLEDRQIILITGLRRVGKTKLLYQIIQHLLDKGIDPKKILYFSFDEEKLDIKDILESYEKLILGKSFNEIDRIYIFFDEIQKCENWENKIKIYYDLYPNIKFFLSGSASLILSKKSKESLAGRVYEFELKPLTFKEFVEMKNSNINFEDVLKNAKVYNENFLKYFFEFIKKSGFPELVKEENEEKIEMYIKSSVIDRVIYKDLSILFKRVDVELLETLVKLFFKNPGLILNYEKLSKDLKRSKLTIMNYVHYLRFSLLINLLSNFRASILASSRKYKKVYPATSSLIFCFYEKIDDNISGKMLETIVCSEINVKNYFRKGNKEIDFIEIKDNEIIPIEVKTSVNEIDVKNFAKKIKDLKTSYGIILTLKEFNEYEIYSKKIYIFPIWFYLIFKDKVFSIKTNFNP